MVERLEKLRELNNNFDSRTTRWKSMRINGWELRELDWDKLDDKELLDAFEKIVRRHYTQM